MPDAGTAEARVAHDERTSRLRSWSPLLVFALVAGIQLPFFDRTLSLMDEGHILLFADIVAKGGELYRDASLLPLPGSFYFLALAFELFGPSILVARWIVLLEFALLCGIGFAVVRRLASERAAWVGVSLMLVYRVWVFPHWHMYSYSTMSLLLLAIALFAAFRQIETGRAGWLGAAGTAAGLAVLCKQDYGVAGLVALNAVLLFERLSLPRETRAGSLRWLACLNLPAVAIGALTALHFLRQGLFGEMLQQTLLNHLIGIATFEYSSLPPLLPLFEQSELIRSGYGIGAYVPGILFQIDWTELTGSAFYRDTILWDLAIKGFFYAPYLLVAVGALRLYHLRERRHHAETRIAYFQEAALFALAALLIAILNKPVDFVHVAVLYWPLLWLVVIWTSALLTFRPRAAKCFAWVAVPLGLGLGAYSAHLMAELVALNSAPLPGERAGVSVLPNEARIVAEAVDYLTERSTPDQPVAVLPYYPLISFLADRRGPHRATYTFWPIEYIPDRERQIIDAIEAADTRVMLYHYTQFAQFPRMREYAPKLFAYLVDAWEVERVMSEPGFGMMVAGLVRSDGPPAGRSLIEAGGANVSVSIRGADGSTRELEGAQRDELFRLDAWPFRPVAALRPLVGGRAGVMSLELDVPAGARLETAVGVHPDHWFKFPPAKVRFEIWAVDAGERTLLASRTLNPQGNHLDRRWFDLELPLDRHAGRRIALEFTTSTDRTHAEIPEMGGFELPRLVTR